MPIQFATYKLFGDLGNRLLLYEGDLVHVPHEPVVKFLIAVNKYLLQRQTFGEPLERARREFLVARLLVLDAAHLVRHERVVKTLHHKVVDKTAYDQGFVLGGVLDAELHAIHFRLKRLASPRQVETVEVLTSLDNHEVFYYPIFLEDPSLRTDTNVLVVRLPVHNFVAYGVNVSSHHVVFAHNGFFSEILVCELRTKADQDQVFYRVCSKCPE